MYRHVTVPLFEPIVLLNEVKVVPPDHNGPLHLHLLYDTSEDASPDGDISSERAFLIYVSAIDCLKTRLRFCVSFWVYFR